jgi:DNA-binding transcriptional MerR regulator
LKEAAESLGLYPIAVACQLAGLSPRTLRLYEQEGLISPQRRSEGGRRLYSNQDIVWIRCIRELVHEHGLTTTAIRRLLDLIPCWEIKRCSAEQIAKCAPHLNIPDMAIGEERSEKKARAERFSDMAELPSETPSPSPADIGALKAPQKPLEFRLFYGVTEFGTVFSCTRCIQAERIIRRLAAKHGIPVEIHKHDILSPEAEKFGIILTPTILFDGKVISAGKALSQAKLEQLLRSRLSEQHSPT